jgi:hypothetical protein
MRNFTTCFLAAALPFSLAGIPQAEGQVPKGVRVGETYKLKTDWDAGYFKTAKVGDYAVYANGEGKFFERLEVVEVGDRFVTVKKTFLDPGTQKPQVFYEKYHFSRKKPAPGDNIGKKKTFDEKLTIGKTKFDAQRVETTHLRFTWNEWFSKEIPFHQLKRTDAGAKVMWVLARYRKGKKTVDLGTLKENPPEVVKGKPDDQPRENPRGKPATVVRVAEPAAAAQAKVEEALKDLYMKDYAKKTPKAMLTLAVKLYEQGQEASKLEERFVLLREARDLAARALNTELALRAIDALGRGFTVKTADMKRAVLDKIAGATRVSTTLRAVAEAALAATDEAVAQDDLDAALRLGELARKAGAKVNSVALTGRVKARLKELETLRDDFPAVKAARAKLKRNPDDPEANVKVGKYLCLAQGKWDEGLALLAKGGDAKLKALAEKVAGEPAKPADRVAVADLFWGWADREQGSARDRLQEQARAWYWKGLPELDGLDKVRVEKRLRLVLGKLTLSPGLVTELFNDTKFKLRVKARIDYKIDFDWGQDSPDPAVNKDNFGVRWWGYLKPPKPGLYTFRIKSDNGCRIWIDRVAVVKQLDTSSVLDQTFKVYLNDKPHVLLVEFLEGQLTAYIHLTWTPPGETKERAIPASAFYHSAQQAKLLGR